MLTVLAVLPGVPRISLISGQAAGIVGEDLQCFGGRWTFFSWCCLFIFREIVISCIFSFISQTTILPHSALKNFVRYILIVHITCFIFRIIISMFLNLNLVILNIFLFTF